MLIIPEIETVVLLVPRTGSGSLRRAIVKRYPGATLLYRHMEADGLPLGYDRWRRVGIVRHPIDRLWSLYKFLRTFDAEGKHDAAYSQAMRDSATMTFSDWLLHNEIVFTSPYDRSGLGRYWPEYTVRHPLPENRKSQFMYLRPDLGTRVFTYDAYPLLCELLDVKVERTHNATCTMPRPQLAPDAMEYAHQQFEWDFRAAEGPREPAP